MRLKRIPDPELRDDGLASPGRGGDHDGIAVQERADRFTLELVQGKRIKRLELRDFGIDPVIGWRESGISERRDVRRGGGRKSRSRRYRADSSCEVAGACVSHGRES